MGAHMLPCPEERPWRHRPAVSESVPLASAGEGVLETGKNFPLTMHLQVLLRACSAPSSLLGLTL